MILKEESEFYEIYAEEERKQLIFNIFSHFIIGG